MYTKGNKRHSLKEGKYKNCSLPHLGPMQSTNLNRSLCYVHPNPCQQTLNK